jgi:hypothetical protein
VFVFIAAVGGVFAVAFVVEGRWALSILAANLLGMVIAAGAALWLLYQVVLPRGELARNAPVLVLLLPYLGPVLVCLLLAKLFRPKQINDFWQLHAVGLMEVILACVLAVEPFFGLLLFAYLVCGLWSLLLFYRYREHDRACATNAPPRRPGLSAFWQATLWAPAVGGVALGLFLLTPPLTSGHWNPYTLNHAGPLSTGFTDTMDLNRTGHLRLSDEVAFEVEASRLEGQPKLDLNQEQRWRGAVLDSYERGYWSNRGFSLNSLPERRRLPRERFGATLPDLGPSQFFINFHVTLSQAHGLFLADPVTLPQNDDRLPILPLQGESRRLWQFNQGDSILHPLPIHHDEYWYRQAVQSTLVEGAVGSPLRVDPRTDDQFTQQPVSGIVTFTAQLLQRLQTEGKLDPQDVTLDGTRIHTRVESFEKVARALSHWLSHSGEYTYSLDLYRRDLSLDPCEDFLVHVKQGHCERFASALTLLLRSCEIPARIVLGYRGAEPDDETPGKYLIRQSAAHSWVEVAVRRTGHDNLPQWYWLTLDPTPSDSASLSSSFTSWMGWQELSVFLWRYFLVDYNAEKQHETTGALRKRLQSAHSFQEWSDWFREVLGSSRGWIVVGLSAGLLALGLRWWKQARARKGGAAGAVSRLSSFEAYNRLLALLEQHLRLEPRLEQTPLEFASTVEQTLRQRRATGRLAELPLQLVGLFYRTRYGQQPLTPAEHQALQHRLGELHDFLLHLPAGTAS